MAIEFEQKDEQTNVGDVLHRNGNGHAEAASLVPVHEQDLLVDHWLDLWRTDLVRAAYLVLYDVGRAEDCVQTAGVRAIERLRKKPEVIAEPRAWLKKIVMNTALNSKRSNVREAAANIRFVRTRIDDFGWEGGDETPDLVPIEVDVTDRLAAGDAVRKAVRRLPREARALVVMHYFLDMPYEDVAEVTGLKLGTIKSRLNKARAVLAADPDLAALRGED